ncbi:MAG: amidohydrolase family protein [Nitrospiraceae bacterium]|nr:amidohydrolase family protein [Nitrospiraceae bacterium]
MSIDLVVRGGRVVTPAGDGMWDIAVSGEKIAAITTPGTLDNADALVVDAKDKIVVPGGIEPHAHQCMHISQHPELEYYSLGPEEDSIGMVHGGVTTHLDFSFVVAGEDPGVILRQREDRWKGNSYTDYSFHIGLLGEQPLPVFDRAHEFIEEGYPSFKAFTVDTRKGFRLDYGRLANLMQVTAKHGGIVSVHAEDDDTVRYNYERAFRDGRIDGWHIQDVRSHLAEELAIRQTLAIAKSTGSAVYFVHCSTRNAVELLSRHRAAGEPVYGETLHHYLCRNSESYREPRGFCHHTYPSLKLPEDCASLWSGIMDGTLSCVATDEMPTSLAVKLRGERIDNLTGGNLGAEARMGIMFTEGVALRGMSLARFVEVTSSDAARIFGLYPKKGVLVPGADADIVLIDPHIKRTLTREDFHVSDYSPWEGWMVTAWPTCTILRGRVVVEHGVLVGARSGRLVPRYIERAVLEGPLI